MDALKVGQAGAVWCAQTYTVKVRGERYLWGSAGLTSNLQFEEPFILHIENDQAGEPISLGTRRADGVKTALGAIQPGERLSIQVDDISGVYAACASESLLHCMIA